jgi:hypothetical protein
MEADVLRLHEDRLISRFKAADDVAFTVRPFSRGFMLSKPFSDKAWGSCRLQGGDGDLAFY